MSRKVAAPGNSLSGRAVMPEVSGVLGNSWGLWATLCYVLAELAVENDLQTYTCFSLLGSLLFG